MINHKSLETLKPVVKEHAQAIAIDTMYQDEWITFLNSITEKTWIRFLDATGLSRQLLSKISSPSEFLNTQFELVYGNPEKKEHYRKSIIEIASFKKFLIRHGFVIEDKLIDENGNTCLRIRRPNHAQLPNPSETDSVENFPQTRINTEQYTRQQLLAKHMGVPLVLNIGSGGDESKKIPHAINGDVSEIGKPQIVFDAKFLPFPDDSMTMIMASHVFENLTFPDAVQALSEWLRVLHPSGVLRIAVPNGQLTLSELEEGFTADGSPAYDLPNGSPSLTQLQGFRGEHSKTHHRWRKQVLYTFELIEKLVQQIDDKLEVSLYSEDEALSELSGLHIDETNKYSLKIQIQKRKTSHIISQEITHDFYLERKKTFLIDQEKNDKRTPISIIVPIRNEAANLPLFLENLTRNIEELQSLGIEVEAILALNGCTDESEEIITTYVTEHSHLPISKAETEAGILNAFLGGIHARKLDGAIAKLDVDTSSKNWTLSHMYMHLLENEQIQVTYAEALPSEENPVIYNLAEWYQQFRSRRNYFHGRMSLYRENPLNHFSEETITSTGALAEDVIFSCLYAYYKGLSSMQVTPGAVVRSTSLYSYEKLYKNWARARTEIKKICKIFPQFEVLKTIMQREAIRPNPELESSDPELYYLWLTCLHLQKSLAAAAKAAGHYSGEGTLFGTTEIFNAKEWSLRQD